jgi:hypothetical protein
MRRDLVQKKDRRLAQHGRQRTRIGQYERDEERLLLAG